MDCRRCRTENPDSSRYCSACGALLTRSLARPRRRVPWYVFAGAGALAVVVAAYVILPGLRLSSSRAVPEVIEAGEPSATSVEGPGAADTPPPPASSAIAVGRFVLSGSLRGASSSIDSALFDGSWAALPLWAFMGPAAPRLEGPGPSVFLPAWVDWSAPEPVVLCRFDLGEGLQTPELAPYDGSAVLEWRPLSGERASFTIETGPLRSDGSFKAFGLFNGIEAPGVLVQGGRIVGWTFGQGMARGYLWAPAVGAGPALERSAADLSLTLGSGWREAAFIQALSLPDDGHEWRKLEGLAAGFRSRVLLAPDDLPLRLKPAAVAARMTSLVSSLVRQGRAEEVARVLDPDVLSAAADIGLIRAAAGAFAEARGFESAHRLLSDLGRNPAIRIAPVFRELAGIEVELAKVSLHKILNERGYGGLEIFDQASALAPDDLELHLLGVEAAVLEKNWVRGEQLLRDRSYPTVLSDKARTLDRLIDEGRRDEDSVTIRFNPGDRLIPVYAYLNKALRQKFYIDTGATTTIIPTSAAAALEIRIDNSTPVVGFQGVAGGDLAYQVPIDSIEIEGLTVFGIRALVYDLGDEEGAGLLGNDVLQHFQVDLDGVRGVLKLRKK